MRSLFRHSSVRWLVVFFCAIVLGFVGYVAERQWRAQKHYRQGMESLKQYRYSEARMHFLLALEVRSEDVELRVLVARTYRLEDNYQQAEAELGKCRTLRDPQGRAKLEREMLAAQTGDMEGVETDLLERTRNDHPEKLLILEALSRGYLSVQKIGAAHHTAEQMIDLDPDYAPGWLWRGLAFEHAYNLTEALRDYRKAIELNPENDSARLMLANLLVFVSQPYEALGHLEKLHESQPNHATVRFGLAQCCRLTGKINEARELLEGLDEQFPNNPEYVRERGLLEQQTDNNIEAEKWLRRAYKLTPNEQKVVYALYLCLRALRSEDEKQFEAEFKVLEARYARLEVMKQQARKTKEPADHVEVATIFFQVNQEQDGVAWLQRTLAVAPDYAPAHKALADYFERKGRNRQAQYHRERAARGKS